jgi:hypothetical protein
MDVNTVLDSWPLLTLVGSVGVAWGTVKVSLNGLKTIVNETRADQRKHESHDNQVHLELIDRLARIETKLDDLRDK